MPTFDTPEPVWVTIDLVVGDARIVASDREDTVVEVNPSDPSHEPDLRAAEQIQVEYAAGRLLVKAPKQRTLSLFSFGKVGAVDVRIALPTGSHVQADTSVAAFRGVGRLGECRIKTSIGDIQLDHTGTLDVSTSGGAVSVDRVAGDADVSTGTGRVRLRAIDGAAVVKSANGDTWVGEVGGDLRVDAANGDVRVDRAAADVTANTANGDVRIGGLVRGTTSLKTAHGEIEIGVHPGTAARLDVATHFGAVRNHMDAADGPEPSDEKVEVRARTSFGDVVIRRS